MVQLPMVQLPVDFVGNITNAVGVNITALAPVLVALIGLVLAFWVIKRIIGLFPRTR